MDAASSPLQTPRRCVAPLPAGLQGELFDLDLPPTIDATEYDDLWDASYRDYIAGMECNVDSEELTSTSVSIAVDLNSRGDIVRSNFSTSDLLAAYCEGRDPLAADNPEKDLDALDARHFLRRSARLKKAPSPPASRAPKRVQPKSSDEPPAKKRQGQDPCLATPNAMWRPVDTPVVDTPVVDTPVVANLAPSPPPPVPIKKRKSHARPSKGSKSGRGQKSEAAKLRHALNHAEFLAADAFSLLTDATFSFTGWQGGQLPEPTRVQINALFHQEPDARALHPWVRRFYPAAYKIEKNIADERATFFADKTGQIFMFRSYRAVWLRDAANEVAHAVRVLVGDDHKSASIRSKCANGLRGPHMPIIIGHQRQSAQEPRPTAWQNAHQDRVDEFMGLEIVKRIIGHITRLVETVFPGIAARFRADAKWHRDHHQFEPMFGLFWNFCLNAWFIGQKRIHCDPHADRKNQIGICVLLIYIMPGFENFNHSQRTWIVLWEAGVAVELPPWTVAMYPSALFYHFNIDVHDIEFVTVDGEARPTRENSTPIRDGDECGRGSMVFFNQSTMRHGPATGYDTLIQARAAGHSGSADRKETFQEVFQRHLVLVPISPL